MRISLLLLLLFYVTGISAQTNPTPLSLPVNENFGTTSFTTPKPGMASWTGGGTRPYTSLSLAELSDGGANLASISGTDPVSGNSGGQYGHAPSGNGRLTILGSSNATTGTTQVVMAINTVGISSVSVSYDLVETVVNSRDFGIALQYRVGSTGNFTTIAGSSAVYNSSSTNGGDPDGPTDFDTYTFLLPNDAADEPEIQLRWITWRPATGSGSMPGIGIDNIVITSGNLSPCAEPTAQATALNLTPSPTSISGFYSAAVPAADQYLVIRSTSPTLSAQPVDGTNYAAGQSLGGGTVVQVSSSTSFFISGLTPATAYTIFVYALNNSSCSGGPNYLLTNPLTGSTNTPALPACAAPAAAPTALNLNATNTSITGSFTASASANRYLVVRSTASSLSANPVNGTTYTNGQSLGGGTVVAYGSTTSFNATGLTKNTLYYFFIFAANGECSGEPVYFTTSLNGNISTTNTNSNLPPNYYNAATGLSCAPLKTALSTIISTDAIQLTYTPGVWTAYAKTDIKRNFENTRDIIWDMYSDRGPGQNEPYEYVYGPAASGGNQCGNYSKEGDCYNREHSFPQSWFNSTTAPMYTDVNHLFPTDGWVNNLRSSFPFGEVTNIENTPGNPTQNGSKRGTGNNFGYTGTVFEPINEYKGDFARAQFYMVTRYESLVAGWQSNGSADAVLNGTAYQAFDDWHLKLLYKWHLQDPVSQKEIDRNDSIFVVQGNRNPYIDNPQWVFDVWNCTGLLTTTSVNDILNLPANAIRIYPNPVVNSNATVRFEKAFTHTTTLQIMDLTGRMLQQQLVPAGQTVVQIQTRNLQKGMYILKINTREGISTRSIVVQ
ncbi:endonuclease [Lacibacter sp. MH-610]|uniref:endonuclease n=1 Tax=Lacibacter sp. MH-610 TaxID=3020883 RepID=UPI0038919E63